MVLGGRRIPDDIVGNASVGHHVGTLLHLHRRHRGHRFHARDIDLRQLLHEGQDRIELALQVRDLVLRDGDARELGNAANGIGIDGHGCSRGQEP